MRPTKRTTPDDWSRANRTYGPSTGFPGPRDPARTPYVVPFVRAFDIVAQLATYGARYDAAVMVSPSQAGKTDSVLDIIGWTLDQRPAPIMYVGPNKEFLHKEIEPRLMDMLTGTPRLKERLATGKRMNKWRKVVGGVPLALAWAGSASAIAGMAAKYVLVDELDRMGDSVQGEGDPFALTEARGHSFRDRMRGAISTPLLGAVDVERDPESGLEFWKPMLPEDVQSKIWRLWQSGTMHHWSWPCPHCAEYFIPRFRHLRGIDDVSPVEAKRSAFVECPRCGGVIEEHHKAEMNRRGVYVAPGQSVSQAGVVTGKMRESTTLSFWVSGLCSPFVTFGERAAAYVGAKLSGEQEKIQSVINTGFGECFAPGGGDVPEWEEVAALKLSYQSGQLPDGVKLLTLAADVQRRRIVYTIRGWGARATSWLIKHGELHGPTTERDVWDALAELLHEPIGGLVIRRAFLDSGFRPGKPDQVPVNRVYEFCRRFPRLVFPTKGRATMDRPLVVSKIEVTAKGDAKKYGLDLVLLDTDHCKGWVHERIRWEPDKPGAWLLPEDTSDGYCKQIVSEARVRKPNGTPTWVPRSRENHYLDCEAMQAGLAHMLNVHLIRDEARAPDEPRKAKASGRAQPAAASPPAHVARQSASEPSTKPDTKRAESRAERRKRIADLAARIYGAV